MTSLFRQLLTLSENYEDAFHPECAARLKQDPAASELAEAFGTLPREEALLVALRALCAQRDDGRADAVELELVATTPGFISSVARSTEDVLFDLIAKAKHQLIAVGYWITNQEILRRFHVAAETGVDVIIVTDRASGHAEPILNGWPRHLPIPRVYEDKPNAVSAKAKMHGKALFADGERLFISSANFTRFAMNANIELGVLLSGPRIAEARVLFDELFLECDLLERVQLRCRPRLESDAGHSAVSLAGSGVSGVLAGKSTILRRNVRNLSGRRAGRSIRR
jgi:phosphatidylserine/phosphatidylglycerophosphate/cardiolipin synthase-like enzyme